MAAAVLSIARLGKGGADYYIEAVAQGAEDYYLGSGEAPGYWLGAAAGDFGQSGRVGGAELHAVLAGTDPRTGEVLASKRRRVPGFDLSFRAPKSVSLLYGLGDAEVGGAVVAAHEEAVEAAVGYLEREVGYSRRGRNGVERVKTSGFVAAAFRHRTSRAGDPHLHTHVLVANLVEGSDGKWATLDSKPMWYLAKTAGFLYEAHLRAALTDILGVEWGPVVNGIADIEGFDKVLRDHFSQRRKEIDAHMSARGTTSPRAAEVAALITRQAKDYTVDGHTLRVSWRERAREVGFDIERIPDLLYRVEREPLGRDRFESIADHLSSPRGLTEKDSTFTAHDVARAYAEAATRGATISEIETQLGAYLERAELRRLPALDRKTRAGLHTTAEMLAIERAALATAAEREGEGTGIATDEALADALGRRPTLSAEQVEVIETLCSSGNGVDLIVAKGGSGKTFSLDAARDAWQASGRQVIGCATAATAAAGLQATSGIRSSTIARLLNDLDTEHSNGLPADSVLVVDEAGMVGTRTIARLLDHAERANVKVVLVGDPRQLPEIDAGGLLNGLDQRLGALRLTENRRQRHRWEREALREFRAGDFDVALAAYETHGRIVRAETASQVREVLVGDWWASRLAGEDALMLAPRRADVDDLNARARIRMQHAERLSGPELVVDERPYQRSDEILCLRNACRLGVLNGTRATITKVDPDGRTINIDTGHGAEVTLPAWYVEKGHIAHGYATTVHKAQGMTVDRALVLGSDALYREMGYTAMSRGRDDNRLYLVGKDAPDPDDHHLTPQLLEPDEIVYAALEKRRSKDLAVDNLRGDTATRLAVLHAEQRRLNQLAAQAPPDPTRERESLTEARRRALAQLDAAQADREAIRGIGRRVRARRAWADGRIEQARQRIAEIDRNLAALADQDAERQQFLAIHQSNLDRAEAVKNAIDKTHRERLDEVTALPPHYLVEALGHPPAGRRDRRIWREAASEIEKSRAELEVTDDHTALGPQPDAPLHRERWRHAGRAMEQAGSRLKGLDRGLDRGIDPPGLAL